MYEEVRIESIEPLTNDKYRFAVRLALREGDSIVVRECLLVAFPNRQGYIVHPPSRPNGGTYASQVEFPGWVKAAIREAAIRALRERQASEANGAVQ
jgi:hypothetical protein